MSGFHLHHASTAAWIAVILIAVGFGIGYWAGVRAAPSYQDVKTVEYRLQEIACEILIRNGLLTTCKGI